MAREKTVALLRVVVVGRGSGRVKKQLCVMNDPWRYRDMQMNKLRQKETAQDYRAPVITSMDASRH